MGQQTWQEVLTQSTSSGPAYVSSTTRTSIIPTANRILLPNNYFYPGRVLRVLLGGRIIALNAVVNTLRFDICMGAAGNTIIYDTNAINLTAITASSTFFLDVTLACQAVGAGTLTTFSPFGVFYATIIGAPITVPSSAPSVGAGTDNTVDAFLDVFCTQTVNSPVDSVTVQTYRVDVLN